MLRIVNTYGPHAGVVIAHGEWRSCAGNHPKVGDRSRQAAGAGTDKHRWTMGVSRPLSKKEKRRLAKGEDRVVQAGNAKKRRADSAMLP